MTLVMALSNLIRCSNIKNGSNFKFAKYTHHHITYARAIYRSSVVHSLENNECENRKIIKSPYNWVPFCRCFSTMRNCLSTQHCEVNYALLPSVCRSNSGKVTGNAGNGSIIMDQTAMKVRLTLAQCQDGNTDVGPTLWQPTSASISLLE